HFCAAVSARSVCRLFLVGSQRNSVGGFLLGRLARFDADLWILPHLRRQNGNVRYAYSPARFRHVPDLVCHRGGAFAISSERHAGYLLHVWRGIFPAVPFLTRPERDFWHSDFFDSFFFPA